MQIVLRITYRSLYLFHLFHICIASPSSVPFQSVTLSKKKSLNSRKMILPFTFQSFQILINCTKTCLKLISLVHLTNTTKRALILSPKKLLNFPSYTVIVILAVFLVTLPCANNSSSRRNGSRICRVYVLIVRFQHLIFQGRLLLAHRMHLCNNVCIYAFLGLPAGRRACEKRKKKKREKKRYYRLTDKVPWHRFRHVCQSQDHWPWYHLQSSSIQVVACFVVGRLD